MTSKTYETYQLNDGTKVRVTKDTANGFTVYSYHIKGRYAFGLLKPVDKDFIQNLYDNGYFDTLLGVQNES